ncbi:hypothetical protein HOLleu_01394 [Holothuria leucospilota]|uniref:C-type lectin domain-containing protein n=1 Tax=Holothuria leucospilota TaxID=206669 RepID=A0A9Q1CNZ1_HOLLE|nr:hypothetical protein HOLleu_01394 [Holothuria leucospilota]
MIYTADEANDFCARNGAQLLYLDTAEEFMFARAIASRRDPMDLSAQTWIGLSDSFNEGFFVWSNGNMLQPWFASWEPGEFFSALTCA